MNVVSDPQSLSKQDLVALVYDLQRQIHALQQENQRLLERLNPPKKKFFRLPLLNRRSKRPGQKPGHPGVTRATPKRIDRVVEQTLTNCPRCHTRLGSSVEVTEHLQEDLIPARVEVTCFKRHRYYCSGCQEVLTAPYAPEEIPHSDLGPQVLTQAVLLKYVHGLPFNKIRLCFQQMGDNLTVSEGALAQALPRVARWLDVETQELLKSIRASPATHVDETGWKVTGVNHWLWAFVTDRIAYYRIDRSRGSVVPKEILGEGYKGIVVSDFYSAYNRLKVRQQKCWVHLLRELREIAKSDPSQEFRAAHRALRRIFLDARRLARTRHRLPAITVLHRHRLLDERLLAWGAAPYRSKTLRRLSARILKHHHQLLTFLKVRGLPWENNQAERLIRPNVIIRNRSYQSRSPQGAATHSALMSLVQTLTLQGRSVGETLKSAYLAHRHGDLTPVVVSQR